MERKRNLFIIDDYVNPQKDAIYQTLNNIKKDYLFLDAQPFCNTVFETSYYRQVWLKLCKEVSEQLNIDIAICGALAPDMIDKMENYIFFNVHWLTILCVDEEKVAERHKTSCLQEPIDITLRRNKWKMNNYKTLFPEVKLFDINGMSDEAVAEAIDRWIMSHLNHYEYHNRNE